MNNFTKEEIQNSREIAKYLKKEIKHGDWFVYEDPDRKSGWSSPTLNPRDYEPEYGYGKNILLWSLTNGLDFLEEKGYTPPDIMKIEGRYIMWIVHEDDPHKNIEPDGDTRLECCLKAVLEILKGDSDEDNKEG